MSSDDAEDEVPEVVQADMDFTLEELTDIRNRASNESSRQAVDPATHPTGRLYLALMDAADNLWRHKKLQHVILDYDL